ASSLKRLALISSRPSSEQAKTDPLAVCSPEAAKKPWVSTSQVLRGALLPVVTSCRPLLVMATNVVSWPGIPTQLRGSPVFRLHRRTLSSRASVAAARIPSDDSATELIPASVENDRSSFPALTSQTAATRSPPETSNEPSREKVSAG